MNRSYRKAEYFEDDYPSRNRTFERSFRRKSQNTYQASQNPQNNITRHYPSKRDNYKFIGEEIITGKNRSFRENLKNRSLRENIKKSRIENFVENENDENFDFQNERNYRRVGNYENEDFEDGYENRKNGFRDDFGLEKSYVEGDNKFLKEENKKLRHQLREGYKNQAGWFGRKDNKKYIEIINENKIFIKENKKYLTKISLLESQINKLNIEKKNKFGELQKNVDLEYKEKIDNLNKGFNSKLTTLQKQHSANLISIEKEFNLKNQQKLKKLSNDASFQIRKREDYIRDLENDLKNKNLEMAKILKGSRYQSRGRNGRNVYQTEIYNNEERYEMEVQNPNNKLLKENIENSEVPKNLQNSEIPKNLENQKTANLDHKKCEEHYITYQNNLINLESLLEKNKNLLTEKNSEISKLKNRNQELQIENETLLIKISDIENYHQNNSQIAQTEILKQKLEDLKILNKNLFTRIENFERNHTNCMPQKQFKKSIPKLVTKKLNPNSHINKNINNTTTYYNTKTYYQRPISQNRSTSSKIIKINNQNHYNNFSRLNNENLKSNGNGRISVEKCVKCTDCGCYCNLEGGSRGIEGRVVQVKTNVYSEPRKIIYGSHL